MSDITRHMLGPHVKALLVQSESHLFLVDPEDYGVGRQLRLKGMYGEDELARLLPTITPESNVLVVGTHVGTLAIPLAGHCRAVSAIEANPVTFELLQANIAINRVSNLTAYNIAASDRQQELKFLVNRSNSGGSKIVPQKKEYQYYSDKPDEITVPGFPLDDKFPDQAFDLIVMDIEGSEYFALRGMENILNQAKTLVVEFVPHHLRNVSNVSIEQFLEPLAMFDSLTVPSLNKTVGKDQFHNCLRQLYDSDQSDDGLLFQRTG
ncbi:FkbM family methyltransferase [Novipirellula herctigrandis]